jgi:hypothetical protein
VVDRPKPARGVAGGEGGVGGNGEQAKANPMVVFLGRGLDVPRGAVAPAAEEDGGGGAPVRTGRGGGVGELRGAKAELLVGLG